MTDLSDRVAVVTGAGGALGRSHAMHLGQLGASVVVNDLGSDIAGEGASASAAQRVVDEINSTGGTAIANFDSVTTGDGADRIVQAAIDAFGRIDILINNAGILRDVSFRNMDLTAFDDVMKVHVYGAFFTTRAAWDHMREAGYGRIVNTSSGSGIYGNFGQVNYAAAKSSLIGMTRSLAIEGQRYGIMVNAIAPLAASRMSEGVMSSELLSRLNPAYVSALVAYLASEKCSTSGQTFSVGGGYYARIGTIEGPGRTFDDVPSIDDIASALPAIQDLNDGAEFASLHDQIARIAQSTTP
ncbi:MAG: SDR family NAD(P)-dependent oxidoreductase [Nitriliruptoraceae bacterium]